MTLQPGTTVDRYEVVDLLGRGGMAVVYRVRHRQLGSEHALKVLTVTSDELQGRLMLEGKAQSKLRHPNIVPVTDVVEVDGCPALVMEYVEGPSLAQLLATTSLDLAQADHLARGILRGVSAAHRHGLVHRDLKPANVLVAVHDGELIPKITDFGLAKNLGGSSIGPGSDTRTGQAMGTPAYMAPEQIEDTKNIDARADIFALGAMLYEMVTGRQPFRGDHHWAVLHAIMQERYESPAELVPVLPGRMQRAIEGALKRDPDERFSSCGDLLAAWNEGAESSPSVDTPTAVWDEQILEQVSQLSLVPRPDSGAATAQATVPYTGDDPTPVEPSPPSRARRVLRSLGTTAIGCLAAMPVVIGVIGWIYGDPKNALFLGGPFIFLIGLCAALSVGASLAYARAWRDGRHPAARWFVFPLLIGIIGSTSTTSGIGQMIRFMPRDDPEKYPTYLNKGLTIALNTDFTALVLATLTLLVVGAAVTWAQRPARPAPFSARSLILPIVAGVAGSVVWIGTPMLSTRADVTGPAPFLVFLVLVAFALLTTLLRPAADRDGHPARWILGVAAVLGVSASVQAVETQERIKLFEEFRDLPLVDGLALATEFSDRVVFSSPAPLLAWTLVAAIVALAIVVPVRRLPFRWHSPVIVVALFVLVMYSGFHSGKTVYSIVREIVPAYLNYAAHWHLGFDLEDADPASGSGSGAVVRNPPPTMAVQDGDVIVGIHKHVIVDVGDLLTELYRCRCGEEDECRVLATCLAPGDPIEFEIVRGPDHPEAGTMATATVTWIGGGDGTPGGDEAPGGEET